MSNKCGLPGAIASHAIQEQINVLRTNAVKLREQDPMALHDIRVATRRIRSILTESAPTWNATTRKHFCLRMRKITKTLGRPREIDVCKKLIDSIDETTNSIDKNALTVLKTHYQAQRNELISSVTAIADYLESDAFNEEQDALLVGLRIRTGCYRKMAENCVEKRRKNVLKAYEKWTRKRSEETLHRLRIEFKKLRYAYELFQSAFETSELNSHLEIIREIQHRIGTWHDHHILADHARMRTLPNTEKEKALLEKAQVTIKAMADALLQDFTHFIGSFLKSSSQNAFKTTIRAHPCKVMHRPKRKNKPDKNTLS